MTISALKMFLLLSIITASPNTIAGNLEIQLWENNSEGYAYYRIPAIITAPNGDLLAFCEGRRLSIHDFGDIDIVMKRSTNNGKTWGQNQVVAENGALQAGNPGPVVDPDTGTVWLLYNTGDQNQGVIRNGTGVREVWAMKSTNNGHDWDSPVNITVDVHRPNEPTANPQYHFTEDWRWYAITPGHNIYVDGRIIVAANHSLPNNDNLSHTFLSDDHGLTWQLGGDVGLGTNESTAVSLSGGELMINTRTLDSVKKRAVAYSDDYGMDWYGLFRDEELIEPRCEGSLLRYSSGVGYSNKVLFSNPESTSSRENGTIKISYDEGGTWPVRKRVSTGDFAYSDMTVQSNGNVGMLYERGNAGGIRFTSLDMAWLEDEETIEYDPFQNLQGWTVENAGLLTTGTARLFNNVTATKSRIYKSASIPASYTVNFMAKVIDYTAGDAALGVKVRDNAHRLMFQRRSDGFYAITSSSGGGWERVHPTSAFYDWAEYVITVSDGTAMLRTRRLGKTFDGPITWELPANTSSDLLEIWANGTGSDGAESQIDWYRVYRNRDMILNEYFDDLGAWVVNQASIDPSGEVELYNRTASTKSYIYQSPVVPPRYEMNFAAKVEQYSDGDGEAAFGVKVHDDEYRLMFQRRSDGFYAITGDSGGAWTKIHHTSTFHGWAEYRLSVVAGTAVLQTRRVDGVWDGPFSWNLAQNTSSDRVQFWCDGTAGAPAHSRLDWFKIYKPRRTIVDELFDNLNGWTAAQAVIDPPGKVRLSNDETATKARIYRSTVVLPSYRLQFAAKVLAFSDGETEAALGVKVHDGEHRLMFQRRSDGFYAITDTSGGWTKIHHTSTYHGWVEYKIDVDHAEVTFQTRVMGGAWDGPFSWRLPANTSSDFVELWSDGTPAHPAHSQVDWYRLTY